MQPSVATDSQHEGDKEAGKEATAEPTETGSREATGTSGFRNSGEVTSRVVSNWNGFVSALNDNSHSEYHHFRKRRSDWRQW